jgi:hypothetical protein
LSNITNDSARHFNNGTHFKKANMQIMALPDVTVMLLHGNPIAYKYIDGTLKITNAGWFSNTTKDRLNSIAGVSIVQRNYVWYLNDEVWDGKLTTI